MSAWMVILGAAGATYLIRISGVVLLSRQPTPEALERGLRLAAPAALAAVLASAVLTSSGSGGEVRPMDLAALAGAAVVTRWTRKPLHGLIGGLAIAALASAAGLP